MWSTGAAVTFGYTFAQPRATYSTHPMPVPGGYAFAHSDNSRAAVLSRSASSLCPPSGKTFPSLYGLRPPGNLCFISLQDWWIGCLHYIRFYLVCQWVNSTFSRMYFCMIYPPVLPVFLHSLAKRSPLPVHCRRILHTKDRVSSAGSDKARPFAVFGLGYRRNHVPERGLAALPLPVIL